jgi:hypothetical protein
MNGRPIHRRRCADRAGRGMVLLEVITALFIFTLVAFALVMALDSSFDAAFDRNQVDTALRGLTNQMELLHSARVTPGETDLPDDGSGIIYHLTIAQEQMQDQKNQPVPNMYRATITATWKARGQPEERDVSELIYQP